MHNHRTSPQFWRYPLTAGVGLLAIAVTAAWAFGWRIDPLVMDPLHFPSQPWRLFTSTLPHGGIFHLAFNVYWLWVFGTFLEKQLGGPRYAGLLLLLAAGSSAAEFALLEGGVGLSGIGYGLFGMVWVLSRQRHEFADVIDQRTVGLFVLWFFLCIAMTLTHVMAIANIAHAVGALLGILVGFCYVSSARRKQATAALVALLLLIATAATVARPWVNLSDDGASFAYAGYEALEQHNPARAVDLYQQAVRYRKAPPGSWYNLGIAYQQQDQTAAALACYRHALRMDPSDPDFQSAIDALQPAANQESPSPPPQNPPPIEPAPLEPAPPPPPPPSPNIWAHG